MDIKCGGSRGAYCGAHTDKDIHVSSKIIKETGSGHVGITQQIDMERLSNMVVVSCTECCRRWCCPMSPAVPCACDVVENRKLVVVIQKVVRLVFLEQKVVE